METSAKLQPPPTNNNNSLQPYEALQLEQIDYAFAALIDENSLEIVGQMKSAQEILNHPSLYIVPIVTFCKRLPSFRSLPPSDQLILFKSFFPEVDSVRISYRYDPSLDGWTGLADSSGEPRAVLVKMADIRRWTRVSEMTSVFDSFVRALHEELEDDLMMRNLVRHVWKITLIFCVNNFKNIFLSTDSRQPSLQASPLPKQS